MYSLSASGTWRTLSEPCINVASPASSMAIGDAGAADSCISLSLICALEQDNCHEAKSLIELDIGLDQVTDELVTCEMIAAKRNNIECLDMLLARRRDHINDTDMYGWTALMYACYYGHADVAKCLLLNGARVEFYDTDHMSALIWSAGRGHVACVAHLIKLGHANVNQVDKRGTSPLIWACRRGFTHVASLLLKEGANIDCIGVLGWSALLVAVHGNHVETVKTLLEHKPNVNTCDQKRETPLIVASREGNVEIVGMLLKVRAFVNLTDECGQTALVHAAKAGHSQVVDLLLRNHANIGRCGADKKIGQLYSAAKKRNKTDTTNNDCTLFQRFFHTKPAQLEHVRHEQHLSLLRRTADCAAHSE